MPIRCGFDGAVAIVAFANPPVNTLSVGAGIIDALAVELARVLAMSQVKSVVLAADGRMFSAGADIADFDRCSDTLRRMRALTSDTIEKAAKPIVVAIQGVALGGGLELAMAGHYRICAGDAKLGLPEVTIGLLPGGGGTQRLPRLVGAARALEMMLGGKQVSAEEALKLGLVDRIATADLRADAIAWAATLGDLVRRSCDRPIEGDCTSAIVDGRSKAAKSKLNRAPTYIVDCVEAACTRSFAAGMEVEAMLFERLRTSENSLGLRHAFYAQRQVGRIPGLPQDLAQVAIESVAVIGAGTMGIGITLSLLAAGLPVILIESNAEALATASARIRKAIDADVVKGRLSGEESMRRLARLTLANAIDAASTVDLVIEAVFEDMDVKREVIAAVDRVMKPTAIVASNTSTLDLDVIAGFSNSPERVVGLHFFSPANVMRLLEVVRGKRTAPGVLATAMTFANRIGKVGVVAGVCDGFIGNRIFEEYLRQAYFLVEEGALPQQVDQTMEAWGMAMGPFRTMDLAGQDIGWSIRKRRTVAHPDRPYSKLPDKVCEMGRLGQKTAAGFYLYADGRTAQADPQIDALVIAHSAEIGVERRAITDAEIVDRCVIAMINEGAWIVQEGMAYRPLDIDVVYLNGYGFPAERGGPMFHADQLGLPWVLERITALSQGRHGWAWTPAPLLAQLVEGRRGFSSLNV